MQNQEAEKTQGLGRQECHSRTECSLETDTMSHNREKSALCNNSVRHNIVRVREIRNESSCHNEPPDNKLSISGDRVHLRGIAADASKSMIHVGVVSATFLLVLRRFGAFLLFRHQGVVLGHKRFQFDQEAALLFDSLPQLTRILTALEGFVEDSEPGREFVDLLDLLDSQVRTTCCCAGIRLAGAMIMLG